MLSELLLSLCFLYQPPGAPVPPATPAVVQPAGDGFTVSLPKTLKGEVGELIELKAESGADLVTWAAFPGLRFVHPDPPDPSNKSILIHSKAAGVWDVFASIPAPGGKGTRVAVCRVTIGTPEPPPPPPAPTFQSKLQEAFTAEADPDKATQIAKLASVYRTGATHAADIKVLTWGDLFADMAATAAKMELAGKLKGVQAVIGAELNAAIPAAGAVKKPIDEAGRKLAAATFARIAESLGALK